MMPFSKQIWLIFPLVKMRSSLHRFSTKTTGLIASGRLHAESIKTTSNVTVAKKKKKKKIFNLSKQIPFCITVSLSWRRGHISYRDDNANGRRQRAIGRMLVRHRSFCWSTDWNLLHCHFKLLDGKFLIANHLWLIQCHISSISFGFRLVVSWNL